MKKILSIFLVVVALSCGCYACNNDEGNTPLHIASFYGDMNKVKLLLEQGFDVDIRNDLDETPLYFACKRGNTETVKLLLEHGANPNAKKYSGKTPIFTACKDNYVDVVKLLLKYGANVNVTSGKNITPLYELCNWCEDDDYLELVKVLLDHGANANPKHHEEYGTPLSIAVKHNNFKVCILLVEHGANPNTIVYSFTRMPILNYLCTSEYTPDEFRAEKNKLIKSLLDHGADVNSIIPYEHATPLFSACMSENIDILKILLKYSPDVNIPAYTDDYTEITPLQMARENKNTEIAELLLKHGAKEQQQSQHKLGTIVAPDTECPFLTLYNSTPCTSLMGGV